MWGLVQGKTNPNSHGQKVQPLGFCSLHYLRRLRLILLRLVLGCDVDCKVCLARVLFGNFSAWSVVRWGHARFVYTHVHQRRLWLVDFRIIAAEALFFRCFVGISDIIFDIVVTQIGQLARFLYLLGTLPQLALPPRKDSRDYSRRETWWLDLEERTTSTHCSDANESTD